MRGPKTVVDLKAGMDPAAPGGDRTAQTVVYSPINFQTKDVYEAAFIACFAGMPSVERVGARAWFAWADAVKAKQLSRAYWENAPVEALKMGQMMRSLKDMIYRQDRP